YVWTHEELSEVISRAGGDVEQWTEFLGAVPEGNWEGVNILHEPVPRDQFAAEHDLDADAFTGEWERIRAALAEHREQRVHPGVDDKVLTEVNALAIQGLVIAGRL